jgi:hypothetical protein
VAQLAKLADLRDGGVLSDDEFREQKRRILGGWSLRVGDV